LGKIYFNERTGEFWEAKKNKRKPPEGFKYTGRWAGYGVEWSGESYMCPVCGVYHPVISLFWNRLLVRDRMLVVFGSRYGCVEASRMVRCGIALGGREGHYRMVEGVREMGLLSWLESKLNLPRDILLGAVRRLLKGWKLSDVEAWILAQELSR
jgi:hypothetical protein